MVRRLALTTLVVLWLASLPAADSVRAQVGTLSQVAILTTSAAPNQEVFGTSVAVSADGSTIVVGAPAAFGGQRGAVYVFVRPSTGWSSTSAVSAILRSSDSEALDRLGSSVAVSANGDVIVAGAPSTEEQGAVYLWERPSAGWSGTLTQTVKLVPSKDQTGAEVGVSVALSANGGLAIAGAPAAGGEAGAVFVWERPAERWGSGALPETAILTASDGSEGALLGASVSVSADGAMVLAGSPEASNGTSPPGAGYVFLKPATGWTTTDQFTARLIASDSTTPFLGGAVALSGDGTTALLIVNAPSAPIGAGAGYVYVQPSTGWQSMTESATLAPIPGSQANQSSAALNGTGSLAVWGVPLNSTSAPGELALFARPPGGWSGIVAPARTASPSDPTTDGFFGWSTAVTPDGGLVVVGAPGALNGRGSVYLFSGPQLLSFSPATASPGDTVTIVGSNLDGVSGVTFGGVPALQFTAALTQVRAVVGLGATGAVALTTPQGVIALPGFTFAPGASSTAITSVSPSPSAPGAPVLVQFAVSTALGPPSGTVVVQASSGETCSAPVAAGGCQLVFATVGARSISAEFQGNAFFVASTSPGRVHVVQVPTTVALTVAGASLVGETIAASFAVSSSVGVPPGSVTVRANTGERCSAAVSVGSCPLTFLTPGDRVLTARYDGAAGYLASESAPALDSVRAATETAVVGDPTPDPSLVGAAVTVSYTVVSATGVPTGTVVVSATTGEACAATATAGSCSIVFATPGVRSIVATYSGNGLYLASASLPISHTVGVAPLAPTTTTITSVVPSPSLVGRPLTVTYAVTSSVGSPTGAVIVRASTGESCSGAAPAGSCSLVFAAPGSRWLAASYLGSATHAADTSSQVRHTVLDVPPDGLTAGSTSPTRLGAPTELFAAVDGGTGVTFDWSLGTGAAAVGPIVTYTYPAAGRFGALVAATSGGGTLTEAVTVDIVVAPQVVSTTVRTTTSGAVIRVGANPGGASTQLFVDYEPIPGGPLVSVLGATIPAGTWGPVTVAASLADLPAGTTFRYRVRLVSLAGTSASADGQFTTLSGRLFTPAAALNATP